MLMAEGLLNAIENDLNEEGELKEIFNNNDHDFGEVLKVVSTESAHQKIKCIDGVERAYC